MKNVIVTSALALGLAFGTAQVSFAQSTSTPAAGDSSGAGGQSTRGSGQPAAAEQGAGSESKAMAPGNAGMAKDGMKKDGMTKDGMSKDGMKK